MSAHDWRQCYPDERNELIARMRAVFRAIQWTARSYDGYWCCPVCHVAEQVGHAPDCELARLLEETK